MCVLFYRSTLKVLTFNYLRFDYGKGIIMDRQLEEKVSRYINNDSYVELKEYLDEMPCNNETKRHLLGCILQYDIIVLYKALYQKCGLLLTKSEYLASKKRFKSCYDLPYPDECESLDKKFQCQF